MKRLKNPLRIVCGVLLAAGGFLLIRLLPDAQGPLQALPFLCIGVGCGIFGHGLGDSLAQSARKRNPALAKQLDIEAGDERNMALANAAKAKGFTMMTYVFGALMLAFALMGADLTIILLIVGAYLFIQFYAVYIRLKLDKEQ